MRPEPRSNAWMSGRRRWRASLKHGQRGWVTWSTASPQDQTSPMNTSSSSTPMLLTFSPNGGRARAPRRARRATPARCSDGYTYTALSTPPCTLRSAWPSPERFTSESQSTAVGATGAFRIPLQMFSSRTVASGVGVPTLTAAISITVDPLPPGHCEPGVADAAAGLTGRSAKALRRSLSCSSGGVGHALKWSSNRGRGRRDAAAAPNPPRRTHSMKFAQKAMLSGALLGATIAGGAVGASVLGTAQAQTGSSSSSSSTTAPTDSGTAPDPSQGGHTANGITETVLTGDTATQGDRRRAGRGARRDRRPRRERRRGRDVRGAHDEVRREQGDRQDQRGLQRREHRGRHEVIASPMPTARCLELQPGAGRGPVASAAPGRPLAERGHHRLALLGRERVDVLLAEPALDPDDGAEFARARSRTLDTSRGALRAGGIRRPAARLRSSP